MGTAECRGHCRYLHDLEACDAPCSNARDRKLILLVQSLKSGKYGGAAGPVQFDALGALTVSGTTVTNTMPVTIERVDKTKLKFVGSTPLKMTDFDVVPPAPRILGMPVIKTGDDIKISFEWLTEQKAEPAKTQ